MIELLDGGNEFIQGLFRNIFETIDDAMAFTELTNAYTKVLGNLKRYRNVTKKIINNDYVDGTGEESGPKDYFAAPS